MPGRKLTVYLEDELIKEGKKIAIEEDTSLSQILNKLLKEYIDDYKKE